MAFKNLIRSIALHLVLCLQTVNQFNVRSDDTKSYTREESWNISFRDEISGYHTCRIMTRHDDWKAPIKRRDADKNHTEQQGLSQVILEGRGEPAWGLSIRTLPALRSNQVPCLWSGEMPDLGVLTPALLKNALYLDKALSPYNFKKRYCGVRNLGTWSNVVLLGSGPQIISFLCKELNSNNHRGFDLWTFQNLRFKSPKHAPRTRTRGFVTSENEGDWPGVAPPASASPERLCSVWGELWMSNGDGWGEWGFEPASFETSFWLLRPWEVA